MKKKERYIKNDKSIRYMENGRILVKYSKPPKFLRDSTVTRVHRKVERVPAASVLPTYQSAE